MLEKTDTADSQETEDSILLNQLTDQAQTETEQRIEAMLAALPPLDGILTAVEKAPTHLASQSVRPVESDFAETEAILKERDIVADKEKQIETKPRSFAVDLNTISPDEPLKLYFREIIQVPLLTYNQEIALAKQVEKGRQAEKKLKKLSRDCEEVKVLKAQIKEGNEARDHLIKANTRLVISVAKRYRGQGVPFTDLIQEGNLGLMRAVKKFDHRRGYRFCTYATWWIRQAVARALVSHSRTIRIPLYLNDRLRKLHQISKNFELSHGRKPTLEEVADEMGLEPAKVNWMLRVSQRSVSLELPVGEERESELSDFIEDEDAPAPVDVTHHHLLREQLEDILVTLPSREARILRLRYGLQNGQPHSLAEIAKKFGLSRERIRQLEQNAIRQLRHTWRFRLLKEYLA